MGRYLEKKKEEYIWYGVRFGHNVRNMQRQYKKTKEGQIENMKGFQCQSKEFKQNWAGWEKA